MDLLRLSVTKGTVLPLADLDKGIISTPLWIVEQIAATLPRRKETAHVRCALAYKLQRWQRFDRSGDRCKALATPILGSKGLDIRIRVQRRGVDDVTYSDLVLSYSGGAGEPIVCESTPEGQRLYPDLVADLGDVATLQAFGAAHLFDNDLRRLAQDLLAPYALALWPGVLLANSDTQEAITALETLFADVQGGSVIFRLLSLDNTPANREALACELGSKLQETADEILEALSFTDPNLKRCKKLYAELLARVEQAESLLGVDVPGIWETLADIEMQLEALQPV